MAAPAAMRCCWHFLACAPPLLVLALSFAVALSGCKGDSTPALPAGLSLDPSTGIVTGTPSAVTATASCTVTATNSGGTTTATLAILVNDVPPSGLAYATSWRSRRAWTTTSSTALPLRASCGACGRSWRTPRCCDRVQQVTERWLRG